MSGGGAKGGYQVGVMRALEEAGLEISKLVLAGTSIGALNSLAYAGQGTEGMRRMLSGFRERMEQTNEGSAADPSEQGEAAGAADWRALANKTDEQLLPMRPQLMEFMEKIYPDEKIDALRCPVTVCAYSVEAQMPRYYLLNELGRNEKRLLTLASGSLPGIFPSEEYQGEHLLDGGVIPPNLKHPAPSDKIPVIALKDIPLDVVIVSYLDPGDTSNIAWIPDGVKLIELQPSRPLEKVPGTGTMDFSEESLAWREALGYEETKHVLEAL